MCGIIGYVGSRECRDLLLQGLQRLEYRGYDSAGLSLVTNGSIGSVHAVGNLQHLRGSGRLAGDGVAVTVMTNYGFHRAMADAGIEVATTDVGDRHVLAELVRRGWALGGEQSGHIIDTAFVPSGDGIAAALLALEALRGADLADRHAMEKLPQRLVNVRVRDRGALEGADTVWAAVERESVALEGRGRVLVRASGTEPLVRVMVEAPREDECQGIVDRLARLVETELG